MRKYIAEFVGTFVLVLVACGVAVVTNANIVATSLAFGLVIVAMAYSIGNVSGCHINPAVSFAMLVTKKMSVKDFLGYVVSQVLGAISGAGVLSILFESSTALGANGYGAGNYASNVGIALLIEVILTFIFVLAILGVTSKKENNAVSGIVIGLTLTLVHLLGIPFTGTSVNPARSLGPALFQGGDALSQVWVFIVAPLVGAFLAGMFYRFVIAKEK
ncbi:MAG: MIP family channel protein [Bacilli bacterium]|nr:MIP family channel protein [Bacilli bacterium]